MLDTINATLYINNNYLNKLQSFLETMQSKHTNFNTGKTTFKGGIRNMLLTVSEHRIKICGSLSKFYFGNNIQSLTHETFNLAVTELCEITGLPFCEAKINRLDLAQNISVEHSPSSYFDYYGERKYMHRLEQGYGLYYRNTTSERVFYDKTKDVIDNLETLPVNLISNNLLRFEVRDYGHKNICKRYQMAEVTLGKLCEPAAYRSLVSTWAAEYDKIDKYDAVPVFDDDVYRNPKQFCDQITYKGVQALGGQAAVMSLVKQARLRKVFHTTQQYLSIRRKVRSLGRIKSRQLVNPFIDEINTKVLDLVRLGI
ncbi:MAG TPA: phage/plasmid replication protein [Mucilaginibacter sp.]